jgi:hypothetical protein
MPFCWRFQLWVSIGCFLLIPGDKQWPRASLQRIIPIGMSEKDLYIAVKMDQTWINYLKQYEKDMSTHTSWRNTLAKKHTQNKNLQCPKDTIPHHYWQNISTLYKISVISTKYMINREQLYILHGKIRINPWPISALTSGWYWLLGLTQHVIRTLSCIIL